jgi:hypothetical protein
MPAVARTVATARLARQMHTTSARWREQLLARGVFDRVSARALEALATLAAALATRAAQSRPR